MIIKVSIIILVIIIVYLVKTKMKSKKTSYEDDIHISSLYGDISSIQKLLENGVDINEKDFLNRTPLMYAAEDENLETIKFLIEKGANINEIDIKNETALIIALKNDNLETAKILIEYNADTSIKNEDCKNAYDIAKERQLEEIVKIIENRT